jgi:hypothetical protein
MRRLLALPLASVLAATSAGAPAWGWSRDTLLALVDDAADYAPPDLRRQLERHEKHYREGVLTAMRSVGGEPIATAVRDAAAAAVRAIEEHEPFAQIVPRMGAAAYLVAIANDPLLVGDGDADERRYAEDWSRYVESARPRFAVTFEGAGRDVQRPDQLDALVRTAFERGRRFYPFLGREYRRIDFASGVARFDDRSTAFGLGTLSYSHAVSDIIATLRYIWLRSGGADRRLLPDLTPP